MVYGLGEAGAGACERAGIVVAKSSMKSLNGRGFKRTMKAVMNNFMQLLAIIMSLVTLAFSTAAVSMLLG